MTKKTCPHTRRTLSGPCPFFGSVSRNENRAAHGGCSYTETCEQCGAERSINVNGSHEETGDWGDDAETRERLERESRIAEEKERRRRKHEELSAVERAPKIVSSQGDYAFQEEDGMVVLSPGLASESLPREWLEVASNYRIAQLQLTALNQGKQQCST